MRISINQRVLGLVLIGMIMMSCEKELDLPPVDEFSPENVVNSKEGLEALLFSAYQFDHIGSNVKDEILVNEVTTDVGYVRTGAVEREMKPFMNYNWDASNTKFEIFWRPHYKAIRDANTVLENIEDSPVEEEDKREITAEARYLRAAQYAYMYRYFGVVPLRKTTDEGEQPQELPLPTEEEFRSFVEEELLESAGHLRDPGDQNQIGRATKGYAYAVLVKFLMSTKQWEKVVQVSKELMDLNYYQLYPNYRELFFIENEGNSEIIVTWSFTNEQGFGNNYQDGAFPPGYKEAENIPEFTWTGAMANWATQFSLKDEFYDSFTEGDERQNAIVSTYTNRGGNTVNLRDTPDNTRSLKYFDNDQKGDFSGSDMPYIRYADILLSRAEALNEINGPTEESVGLVNQVRTRSIDDPYTLSDVGSKSKFRDIILQERGWEFFSEGKRREDLIRHGKLLDYAHKNGIDADKRHEYFPYPQKEISANPALKQREGY